MKIYVKGGIVYWLLDGQDEENENVLTTDQELGLIKETNTEELLAYLKTEDGVVPLYPTNVQPEIQGYWLLDDNDQTILTDNDEGIWVKWQYSFAVYSETDNSLTFYTGFSVPKVGDEYKHKVVTAVYTGFEDTAYTSASSVPWNSYRTSIKYVRFEDSYIIVQPTATAYWFNGFTSLVDLDVSNLNTSKTTSYSNFATGCTSLKSVTISSRFTLFSKSSQLVDQMTWYDIDKNQVSYNYLISFDKTEGTYWNDIWAIPAKQAIAIYSASDNSLTFYYDYMPTVGTVYNGKVVTALYYDFSATNYNSASEVPWSSYATSVKKVVFDSSYYEVQTYTGFGHDEYYILDGSTDVVLTDKDAGIAYKSYLSTAYWFSGFTNCTSFDLTGLYTATITNMQYMFYGCTSVTSLDLSGFDTGNVVTYNDFLINCDSLEEVIISDTFDLFARSDKALVSQQYWHDSDEYNMNDYLIGTSGNLDLLLGKIANVGFAIYSDSDNSLTFYVDIPANIPSAGKSYGGKTATNVYTDFVDTNYTDDESVPWFPVRESVTTVKIDSTFKEIQPISGSYWFESFVNCTSMDLTNLDTSKMINMACMFEQCEVITAIDVSKFNTSNVVSMDGMFNFCYAVTSLNVSNFDTSKVVDMYCMFEYCQSLTSLDVSSFNTSNVVSMGYMFDRCESLTSLDLSNFDTSNNTSMEQMFYYCCNLTSLNISSFNTSNVTTMRAAFGYLQKLTTLEVGNLNTSNVTNMASMFRNCEALKTLDVSNFDTSKVTLMYNMFYYDTSLTTIYSDDSYFVTSAVEDGDAMFSYDSVLVGGNGTAYSTSHQNYLYAHVDTSSNPGYFTDKTIKAFAVYSEDDNSLTFYSGEKVPTEGEKYNNKTVTNTYRGMDTSSYSSGSSVPWYSHRGDIKSVSFDSSFAEIKPISMAYWFYYFDNCTSFSFTNLDTSNVTSLYRTFYYCQAVTSLNLNSLDTSNVTTMYYTFYRCTKLTSLSISNIDVSNVTTMYYTFGYCQALTSLDLSSWNTKNVTTMAYMFYQCTSITTINANNWDTSKVTTMVYMFYYCQALTSLDLSSWNTSNVTSMAYMFARCNELTTLDVHTFDTSKVTNMDSMFYYCSNLKNLDVSNFNASNATDTGLMFCNCESLTSLDVSNFDMSKVIYMTNMFARCYGLTSLDLSKWNTASAVNMWGIVEQCTGLKSINFGNFNTSTVTTFSDFVASCTSLTSIDVSSFDTSNATTMSFMFEGCTSLTSIDVSNFKTSKVTDMSDMFAYDNNLKTIYSNDNNFVTTAVTSDNYMFSNCSSLVGGNGTKYSSSKVTSSMAHVDTSSNPGYFTSK